MPLHQERGQDRLRQQGAASLRVQHKNAGWGKNGWVSYVPSTKEGHASLRHLARSLSQRPDCWRPYSTTWEGSCRPTSRWYLDT